MNKDNITINGETYFKKQPTPSKVKVFAAKWVKWLLSLIFFMPMLVLLCILFKDLGRDGSAIFIVGFCIAGYIANLIASYATTKLFGKLIMNAIPKDSSGYEPNNAFLHEDTPSFYVGSSGDPDPGNLNYHDRH